MALSLKDLRTARLTLGVTTSVAVAYGIAWPLSFLTPIFTVMFLTGPQWMSWGAALKVIILLAISLLIGVAISEFLLGFPLICVPFYGLVFFLIYYVISPSAPPLVSLFMTLGVTMIPIMGFADIGLAHIVASYLLVNMIMGMFFAWLFHSLLPDTRIQFEGSKAQKPPPKPPMVSENERLRLALVSTIVSLTAVIIFFSLSLTQYALAMMLICIMAGTPNKNASVTFMKGNMIATLIGGIAMIIAYNLLVAVPTYSFLICLVLGFSLLFSAKIFGDSPLAPIFQSGFTTFLVLLGSSTGVEKSAAGDFYLRIAQIIFAGLFTVVALMVVERLLRPKSWRLLASYSK